MRQAYVAQCSHLIVLLDARGRLTRPASPKQNLSSSGLIDNHWSAKNGKDKPDLDSNM